MHPYGVKLQYRHHPWCTVRFEVSYDEIGDADEPEMISVPKEISDVFVALGFPLPAPIPLMSVPHQISQKLHGLSEPGRQRVQDLVDLQLMIANETIDFRTLRDVTRFLPCDKHTAEVFRFVPINDPIAHLRSLFAEALDKHERIGMIFVTKNGRADESLLGIITVWDIAGVSDVMSQIKSV